MAKSAPTVHTLTLVTHIIFLLIGLTTGFFIGTGQGNVIAQQGGQPPQPPGLGGQISGALVNHFQQLQMSLPPDQAQTIQLPQADIPVRIDLSTSQVVVDCGNSITENHGPIAFGGVWSMDSASGKISPLGDNSTGNAFAEVHCTSQPQQGAVEISLFTDEQTNQLVLKNQSIAPLQNTSPINVTVNMWY